jgi:hypothetical protein
LAALFANITFKREADIVRCEIIIDCYAGHARGGGYPERKHTHHMIQLMRRNYVSPKEQPSQRDKTKNFSNALR